LDWTRRDRVIVAASLALALGVSLVPTWFTYVLPTFENESLQGLMDAITTVFSTGYIIAGIMSILLNLVLPYDNTGADDDITKKKNFSGAARALMGDIDINKKPLSDEESTGTTSIDKRSI
jgi:NCS2 family nucleobase:cation symporter-2